MSAQEDEISGEFSFDQFVRFEQAYIGEDRFELIDGHVVMLNGGTERHDLTVMAIQKGLLPLDEGPCRLFTHNRKIRAGLRDGYYPDLLLVCKPAAHRLWEDDARLVVEVLSPSNTRRDRLLRLYRYQSLPSIEMILFVDTDRQVVTVFQSDGPDWTERELPTGDGIVEIDGAVLNFSSIWADVDRRVTTD